MNRSENNFAKYCYKFKHNNTIMKLTKNNKNSYSLSYSNTIQQNLFKFIFTTLSLLISGIVSVKAGTLIYDMLIKGNTPTTKSYISMFDTFNKVRKDMLDFIDLGISLLAGTLLFIALCITSSIILSFLTTGVKNTINLYINKYNNEVQDSLDIYMPPMTHSYLHLLNPEILYNYMKNTKTLEDKKKETARLLEYSKQLKPGFLKDDVENKHTKLKEECRIIQQSCINEINAEKDRLIKLSKSTKKLQKDKKYKMLEDKVLKELAS